MAKRIIRTYNDEILRKKCKKVDKITPRIQMILDDMAETMKEEDGVGLAAPQVGILRNIVVIDVGEGIIELINPIITEQSKETEIDVEGCLSVPQKYGEVERPSKVKVKALNREGKEFELEGEGLLARAICHELDHLNGVLFIDKAVRFIKPGEKENE